MTEMLGRLTSVAAIDLSEAYIKHRRYAEAKSLCLRQRARYAHSDDGYAKWTSVLAKTLIAEQINASHFGASAVEIAAKPLDDWLRDHPEHDRRLFIEHARLELRRYGTEILVAMSAITRHDSEKIDSTLKRVVKLRHDFDKHANHVKDEIDRLEVTRDSAKERLLNDLRILRQKALVVIVGLGLMTTELFAPGSDDQIASASDGERSADQTLIELGASKAAAREVHRMRIQCLMLQGRLNQARLAFDRFAPRERITQQDQWTALNIELMLAEKQPENAEVAIAAAKRGSVSLDLARLRFLLATNQVNQAQERIDQIEERHGLFARRRAEVIALDHGSSSNATGRGLLVNQAHQLIRQGDHQTAAALLGTIARQTSSTDEAIEHAITAAAAFSAAGQTKQAAEVLLDVARLHPQNDAAGKLHLQGLILESSPEPHPTSSPHRSQTLVESLRFHLVTWKTSDSFVPARDWLVRLLFAGGNDLEAAKVQTRTPPELIDNAWASATYKAWRKTIQNAEITEASTISRVAFELLSSSAKESSTGTKTLGSITTFLLDPAELTRIHTEIGEPTTETLARWRRGTLSGASIVTDHARSLSEDRASDLRWRLFRDGELDSSKRDRIARFLMTQNSSDAPTLEAARLLFWKGTPKSGIHLIRRFIGEHPDAESLIEAGKLLSEQKSKAAKEEAIALWDRLAQGAPQDSEIWHLAKLSAIKGLRMLGREDEAAKRVRYLLLTNPSMNPDRKQQYEAFK